MNTKPLSQGAAPAKATQSMVAVTGNTYPVKEGIKALGGRWNPDQKVWTVPADHAVEAQALVTGYKLTKPVAKLISLDVDEEIVSYNNSVTSTETEQVAELERMYRL